METVITSNAENNDNIINISKVMDNASNDNLNVTNNANEKKLIPNYSLPRKRQKCDGEEENDKIFYKRKCLSLSKLFCNRLDRTFARIQYSQSLCKELDEKVNILSEMVKKCKNLPILSLKNDGEAKQTIVISLPKGAGSQIKPHANNAFDGSKSTESGELGQVLHLNKEDDYPNGSWLGDSEVSEMRVRCPISPVTLLHIQQECSTPEKMALVLLDYLFDKETQAISNLSGQGKHGKRKLSPLFIYGIQCHLIHIFKIDDKIWHKLKQKMDSKCRAAFKRKLKGLPLNKAKVSMNETEAEYFATQESSQLEDLSYLIENAEVIQTEHGDLRILQATPDQIAKLHETQQFRIINDAENDVS